jgi:hypothetical protein
MGFDFVPNAIAFLAGTITGAAGAYSGRIRPPIPVKAATLPG